MRFEVVIRGVVQEQKFETEEEANAYAATWRQLHCGEGGQTHTFGFIVVREASQTKGAA